MTALVTALQCVGLCAGAAAVMTLAGALFMWIATRGAPNAPKCEDDPLDSGIWL